MSIWLFALWTAVTLSAPGPATQPATSSAPHASRPDPKPLKIGEPAPDFDLPGVDGHNHRLAEFADAKVLVVIFTCNHCPTANAYEERIKALCAEFTPRGVSFVAISPNDPLALRLDELGYTDLSDSFEEMKIRAREHKFNFPYLYDGDRQEVSRAYGPTATPTVFVFDAQRKLRYVGRVDNSSREERVTSRDARKAIEALLAGQPVPVERTPAVGCSIKWADKRGTVVEAMKKLAMEPVSVETANEASIKALIANKGEHLRLVNVWATWCGSCTIEFPEFVTMHRMYRHRGLEFISISGDFASEKSRVLAFLKKQQASNKNLIFDTDQDAFVNAIDPQWSGTLPLTLLIRPGGEIVLRKQGPIDPLELRRAIVAQLGARE